MAIVHVRLPAGEPVRPLPFYLTMEEWLARNLPAQEMLFLWQVTPTVIFGRNQQIDTEVNIGWCRDHGIDYYRRKSGGGCVYADMDNIMFSYITPTDQVQASFSRYTEMVAAMLRSLGLDAHAGGRNDVLIGDRKVSGNAYYHIPGRGIAHGTMLFSTNMENMVNAITPSRSKLESKKVKSVSSHITTISEHLPKLNIEDFKDYAIQSLCSGEIQLTDKDVADIIDMSQPYYSRRWIEGSSATSGAKSGHRRIEGVGEFYTMIRLNHAGKRIDDINIQGDFFLIGDIDSMLLDAIRGAEASEVGITKALENVCAGSVIAGLTNHALCSMILEVLNNQNQ